ncbi:serine/threonine protein kinase [bacterium]|nr:serine/threonine protein kinase [candidate division CSSED10-310 bacterium]
MDSIRNPLPDPGHPSWSPGTVLLNEFEILSILGEGGMGSVYLTRRISDQSFFAMKTLQRNLLQDPEKNRSFMRELRTWIDLPRHPNLAACIFFKTIDNRLAIFSEYVRGGSLKDWIRQRRLLTLESILDTAIQFAWGLDAAHRCSVVHQDVKPANVLMSGDAVPKVTDFGLARARQLTGIPSQSRESGRDILVSSGGMTLAYCSPEQAAGEKLTLQTDIWSWGLSVLEMFTGSVTWKIGIIAADILAMHAEQNNRAPFPPIPGEVVKILEKCFRQNPAERWENFDAVAGELIRTYRRITGRDYTRKNPSAESTWVGISGEHDRWVDSRIRWDDPVIWLKRALKDAGRNETEFEGMIPGRSGSRKAQALVDLEIFDMALNIYRDMLPESSVDIIKKCVMILSQQSHIHRSIEDRPGTLEKYSAIIDVMERFPALKSTVEGKGVLADIYTNKAATLYETGDLTGIPELIDRAVKLREEMVYTDNQSRLRGHLASSYMNQSVIIRTQGNLDEACRTLDKAIAIWEQLYHGENDAESAKDLATAYSNRAIFARVKGDYQMSAELYDKAIRIRSRLVYDEHQTHQEPDLAKLYYNKAIMLADYGDDAGAIEMYDQAIQIRDKLVNHDGRSECVIDLARSYFAKASSCYELGDFTQAEELFERAAEIMKPEIERKGSRELALDIAQFSMFRATNLADLGKLTEALTLFRECESVLRPIAQSTGRSDLAFQLALMHRMKATTHLTGGQIETAREACMASETILNDLVYSRNRTEYLGEIAHLKILKSKIALRQKQGDLVRKELEEAVSIFQRELERTGSLRIRRALDEALKLRNEFPAGSKG